jgi:hypothetical protein
MKKRFSNSGFALIQAIVGVAIVFMAFLGALGLRSYVNKSLLLSYASTEWRLLNTKLDAFLADDLICERTNLVMGPDALLAVNPLVGGSQTSLGTRNSISYYNNPADPASIMSLVAVGKGNAIEVLSIEVIQTIVPTTEYTPPFPEAATTKRGLAKMQIQIRARARDSGFTFTQADHEINFDVGMNPALPATYLRPVSCYAPTSRRRFCEQMDMVYDPLGKASWAYPGAPAGHANFKGICQCPSLAAGSYPAGGGPTCRID